MSEKGWKTSHFLGLGLAFVIVGAWLIYSAQPTLEEFKDCPPCQKTNPRYQYYQWLNLLGMALIVIGGILVAYGILAYGISK